MNKIKQAFGIVNGKLNICFNENIKNNEIINNENNIYLILSIFVLYNNY